MSARRRYVHEARAFKLVAGAYPQRWTEQVRRFRRNHDVDLRTAIARLARIIRAARRTR